MIIEHKYNINSNANVNLKQHKKNNVQYNKQYNAKPLHTRKIQLKKQLKNKLKNQLKNNMSSSLSNKKITKKINKKINKTLTNNINKIPDNPDNIMKGGNNVITKKDNFEVTTLSNIDPNKFHISKYINANIDWGGIPGPPPTDCSIM